MVRSLGRFDVYFVCFIISDLSRSDTPENTASHASAEREGADAEEGKVSCGKKKKNRKLEASERRQR